MALLYLFMIYLKVKVAILSDEVVIVIKYFATIKGN